MRDDSAAPDAGRVDLPDLPRPTVCYADHSYPAFSAKQMRDYARAAIALADAEAAERRPAATDDDAVYAWVREIYESTGGATPALREAYAAYQAWERAAAGTAGRDGDGREGR